MNETVWLKLENVPGTVLCYGPEFSLIKYRYMGIGYTIWVENEDFEVNEQQLERHEV